MPRLPAAVVFRFDRQRDRWVLLAPERVLLPDEHAAAILHLVDGERSVGTMAEELSRRYAAPIPVVREDVIAFLQDLADRGIVET